MFHIRLTLAATLLVALTACGSGGLGSSLGGLNPVNGSGPICNSGTQVQLANPQPFQTGVPGNIGQIIIVANGDNNNLYSTYNQWYLTLRDQYGDLVTGSNLTLVPYPNGPHPFQSDYYYASNIGQLPSGATWGVNLNDQSGMGGVCSLSSFST
ncbi:MAG TPA: hypothetical protein VFH72_08710 [Candidatus Baltobacteraceae bacterium]|nr:hypothetical protein [Candidatus Baltobacteraceae bacterium]